MIIVDLDIKIADVFIQGEGRRDGDAVLLNGLQEMINFQFFSS